VGYSQHIIDSEIQALIRLVEDPDPVVFNEVKNKLVSYGRQVLPLIELSWIKEVTNHDHHERLEDVLRQIQLDELKVKLKGWKDSSRRDLLEGTLIISQFQFFDIDLNEVESEIDSIKRKVWLEINEENTAFEIVKIFNHVLFEQCGFKPSKQNFHAPQNSYINSVLKNKKGSTLSLSILYSIIAQRLEIPIYGVNLPDQFVLGFMDENKTLKMLDEKSDKNVLFYINPFSNGRIFDYKEIESYLVKLGLPLEDNYIEPCSNTDILKRMLNNLSYSYKKVGENTKVEDIQELLLVL